MNTKLTYCLIAMLSVTTCLNLAGCSEEDVNKSMEKAIEINGKIAETLKKIKDTESAKVAKEKIATLSKELAAASKKIASAAKEEKQRLQDKYGPILEKAAEDVQKEILRLKASKDTHKYLEEAYEEIKKQLSGVTGTDKPDDTKTTPETKSGEEEEKPEEKSPDSKSGDDKTTK